MSNKDKMETLKSLHTQKAKTENSVRQIRADIEHMQDKLSIEIKRLNNINNKIKQKQNSKIHITEHAILQYISRVLEIDIEALKKNIMPETIRKLIEQLGDGVYPVGDFKLKVLNRSVITVLK